MQLTYYSDPGHAWLKAPLKLVKKAGLIENISPYSSYIRGEYAYLEEDSDAPQLLNKLEDLNIKYSIREYHGNKRSRIRGYEHYSAQAANYLLNSFKKQMV